MDDPVQTASVSLLPSWLQWNRSSFDHIRRLEESILNFITTPRRSFFVNIGAVVGSDTDDRVWTVALNESVRGEASAEKNGGNNSADNAVSQRKPPLLLLHGFASGVALWCLNLDGLASSHTVYAIDVLGFGRSSRPVFSNDPAKVEQQFVESIDAWRKSMNIDSMFVLGHSMGAFLAAAYSLRFPHRVEHLILADPWGFADPEKRTNSTLKLPLWARALVAFFGRINPLSIVRMGGVWGSSLIQWARPDLIRKFSQLVVDPPNRNLVSEYIYHCNAQRPSGELAFHTMCDRLGWAVRPMIRRIGDIDADVPITCIYGSRSWIDNCSHEILAARQNSYVDCETMCGASHHVYADQPDNFNTLVLASYDYPKSRWIEKQRGASRVPKTSRPIPRLHLDIYDEEETSESD